MKGEDNISSMIIIFGGIIITLLTIGLGSSMFSSVENPGEADANVSEETESKLASLADECWRESWRGTELERIDCSLARIDTDEEVEESNIRLRLEELPEERLGIDENLDFTDSSELRIRYSPETRTVNISRIR